MCLALVRPHSLVSYDYYTQPRDFHVDLRLPVGYAERWATRSGEPRRCVAFVPRHQVRLVPITPLLAPQCPFFGHHSSHSKKGCPRWHHSAHFWASVFPCQKQGARVGTTVPILGTTPPRPYFSLFLAPVPMGWHESGHAHVRIRGHPEPIMGTNPAGSQKMDLCAKNGHPEPTNEQGVGWCPQNSSMGTTANEWAPDSISP